MALTSSTLRHPSLTYRLTGAMVQAFRSGASSVFSTQGKPLFRVRRCMNKACLSYYSFNHPDDCITDTIASLPGQFARHSFTLQLAAAESSARVHTDY